MQVNEYFNFYSMILQSVPFFPETDEKHTAKPPLSPSARCIKYPVATPHMSIFFSAQKMRFGLTQIPWCDMIKVDTVSNLTAYRLCRCGGMVDALVLETSISDVQVQVLSPAP